MAYSITQSLTHPVYLVSWEPTPPPATGPSSPVRASYQCAYDCAQLGHKIQHWTVLMIFPFIL